VLLSTIFLMAPLAASAAVTQTTISTSEHPSGIDSDSSGNIYIASRLNTASGNLGLLVIPVSSGTLFGASVTANQENVLDNEFTVRGVAVDENDNVFYSTSTGAVYAFASTATTLFGINVPANTRTLMTTSGYLAGPLEFDSSGNLWGINSGTNPVGVLPVSTGTLFGSSVTQNTVSTFPMAASSWVWDIAFDASGNLLYSDGWGNQGVWIYPKTSGTYFGQSVTASTATRLTVFDSAFGQAAGIDTDTAGNVFVANYGNSIYVYSPAGGTFLGETVAPGSLVQLTATSGLTDQGVAVVTGNILISGGFAGTFKFNDPDDSWLASSSSSSSSSPLQDSSSTGLHGIFLHISGHGSVYGQVAGTPIYYGSYGIKPNTTYVLSVQSVTNPALTRTLLATGTVNGGGHLDARLEMESLKAGTYKIVMTGTHRLGYPLVLTNYISVDAAGNFVSISPEHLQPTLS